MSIKGYRPSIEYAGGFLKIAIPSAALKQVVQEELNKYNGRVKRSEFQEISISNLQFNIGNNSVRVLSDWSLRLRERMFEKPWGGWVHSEWLSFSGWLYQDFDLYIRNGVLVINPTRNDISSSNWYGLLVDELAYHFGAKGKLRDYVSEGLREINGANLTNLLRDYKAEIGNESGLNDSQLEKLFQISNSLNANVTEQSLVITIAVPVHGIDAGGDGNPVFSAAFYLATNPDVASAYGSANHQGAVEHWLKHGISEGRDGNLVFSAAFYLSKYSDVAKAWGQKNYSAAIQHWLKSGISEGRQGSLNFDPVAYLAKYPDVAKAWGQKNYRAALWHWIQYGKKEGRFGV